LAEYPFFPSFSEVEVEGSKDSCDVDGVREVTEFQEVTEIEVVAGGTGIIV
jgi:hypothetical protein